MKNRKLVLVFVGILLATVSVYSQISPVTSATDTSISSKVNDTSGKSSDNKNLTSEDTSVIEVMKSERDNNPSKKLISMQFNRASLDQVLNFISRITGLTIVKDADVRGDITIISQKDISVEDALDVLNSALAVKGFTAIQTGNTLKVITIDNAPESDVRVQVGTDPAKIKPGDETITQVMPLNYADALALKKDLISLLPKSANLTSNARSNTLIITSNASNIHRLALIIKELDSPQASVTQIKVFALKNADATDLAKTLNDIFKDNTTPQSGTTGGGAPNFFRQFGGGGRGGGAGGGGGAATDANSSDQVSALDAALARARASVKITVDDRTNSIIVSAPSADMVVLENLVYELDKDATEQEGTLVIHLQHGDSTALATMLNTLLQGTNTSTTPTGGGGRGGFAATLLRATQSAAQAQGGSILGQVKIAADAKTNSLLFITSPRNFERIRTMVDSLDYARPQVMVEVIVAERTLNDETQLGVEWSFSTIGNIFGNLVSSAASTNFNLGSGIVQGLTYNIAHQSIQATIQALKQNSNLNVLSTPRILTSDNAAATIKVGQHVPFLTSRQVTDTGSVFNSFSYQDVGITLTVTPHVNPDGYVSMDVHPIVSQLNSVTFFDAPVIDNREAQTSVMVKDGETVIIGGLMQTSRNDTENKVPILGDIPLLGNLFKYKDNKKVKTELMVFLTPHVVHDSDELRAYSTKDKERLEEMKNDKKTKVGK